MNYRDIDEMYISMLKDNEELYYEDYLKALEKVKNSTAYYKGKPVPFLLNPMFWAPEDVGAFKNISRMITSITDKITDEYFINSDYRKKFGYSELAEKLILKNKGYARNAPMGRYDLFYESPKKFKFCEINTDGASAMNEDNAICEILLQSAAVKEFSKKFNINGFELIDSWVDKLLGFYREWGGENKPNVAILDLIESATSSEFDVFKEAINKKGYDCYIVDPRNVKYADGKLFHEDVQIDLVYRRLVTFELLEHADEMSDFLEAYLDNAFCSVGEIRSQIMHNKTSFKMMLDEETLSFLNEREREFVKAHVPFTGVLDKNSDLIKKIIDNKDDYVIKPMDKNASQGVYIGKDYSSEMWGKNVKERSGGDYLYQEFVEPVKRRHAVFDNSKLSVEEFGSIVGVFIYDGSFQGLYTRISKSNLITGLSDYFTLPNVSCSGKKVKVIHRGDVWMVKN